MKLKTKFLSACLFLSFCATAQEPPYDNILFTNSRMAGSYYFGFAIASGNSTISNKDGKIPVSEDFFHSPGNSLSLQYGNGDNGNWQVILAKKNIRGQDFHTKANFLSFWVYVPNSEIPSKDLPVVRLIVGRRKDTVSSRTVEISLGHELSWKEILIPLESFGLSADQLENIAGVAFSQRGGSSGSHRILVDDISFRPSDKKVTPRSVPSVLKASGYARHIDISWDLVKDPGVKWVKIYRSSDNKSYHPIGIQDAFTHRFADYVGESKKRYSYKISFVGEGFAESKLSAAAQASTRNMSDEEMLTMVQEACFRYYWEGAERNSGLALENINGRRNMIATGASGFGIMALIAGTERKFISRQQSVNRFITIVDFLTKADKFHGAFSHFMDGKTGKVEPFFGKVDNGGDLVETSFLAQGLLAARAYFDRNDPNEKYIRDKITAIWNGIEWDWYRRYPDNKFLFWHWSPDHEWEINHQLIGWNETMVTYLLAIASPTHHVPATMYYSGWANLDSTGRKYRAGWGQTTEGSGYANGNTYYGIKLDVGVSNGGPLFFTHYSYLGYDPHQITDRYTNYFKNNQDIAKINHSYCVLNPGKYTGYGDSCWGLTASDGPRNYSADEPVLRQDKGKIGPTGAISSFPYTPTESMKALKNYYNNYGKFIWGEYGFRDAFNLTENWCSDIYMGLNQAPMVVMIENYRTGLLWKLFMSNTDVKEGLKRLEEVK